MSLNIGSKPLKFGAAFLDVSNYVANTPKAVFTAAQNANGAIIHRATSYNVNSTTVPVVSLEIGSVAPTAVGAQTSIDAGVLLNPGGNNESQVYFDRDVFVPAGNGAWFISNVGPSAGGESLAHALYTLL